MEDEAVISDGMRRWWALIAIAVSALVVGLDLTVLNLALPAQRRPLRLTGTINGAGAELRPPGSGAS
jgi:hypothetical protein